MAVLVSMAGALPASATSESPSAPPQPVYGCLDPVDGYGAPRACQLVVQVLTPVCDKDVPKLQYQVEAVGTPNTTVTITFVNPGGADVVYADQPLSGTVLWPGAVVGPDGRGVDWPGWRQLADGTWVEGDEFDWVRPSVQVNFVVNPEATMTVAYPPSSPQCVTSPEEFEVLADNPTATAAVLSATGSEAQPLLLAGGALVLLGALTVATVSIARRRPGA